MITLDELKRAVLLALGPRPTPAQRRQIAEQLESLATEQRRVAEASAAQARRPAAERVRTGPRRAGPGRAPSSFVRIERNIDRRGYERLIVYVGRQCWYDLGSPRRLAVARTGNQVRLEIADGDDGYAVVAPRGHMPHMTVDGARDLLLGLEDGRYGATMHGRMLTIGERVP